jgi:hypothetical protein
MNEWQVLMAMEARYERGRCCHRPAGRRFLRRWSSFGLRLWRCWGRVEIVTVFEALNQDQEGLSTQAREPEMTIASNTAGILGG